MYNGIKYQVLRHKSNRDGKELYGKSDKTLLKTSKKNKIKEALYHVCEQKVSNSCHFFPN